MDVAAMRATFAKAAAAGDEAPLWFYAHLFLSHPGTRQMFPVSMAHQRDRLFQALGEVVARVDDLDSLLPVLRELGRDHRKFGTLAAHYPAVGASLLATLQHFDPDWDAARAADWTAAYELVASVMIEAAEEAAEQPPWWDADVVGHERRTHEVAVVWLRPREPFPFRAGQSFSLETDLRPRLWRYYSPANAPRDDGLLELHVQARDGGPVSSALVRQLRVGDVVRLGPPGGRLVLDGDPDRDLLLIGAGTGLAPLKALVDQVAREGPTRRIDLFVGARTEDAHYDRADLQRLEREHPWLSVTLAVSRDELSSLPRGDVADVVLQRGPWRSREVYVAGGPATVEATLARIGPQVPAQRIHTEVFAASRPGPDLDGEVTA
ncbi:oxidoreductase [Modestobacter sp. I12A-02628]|uniref:nitric oxide dioxygenase n=1 Tax=Goekera deserti TaxID=2497753 RepID=A0A7K3WC78_9ACTN|nr:globin domain-containing protein [Goekera deserti]MPQ98381.1 oxidoreductase [Goekera deserti]NDI48208.1 oxidoreductase [Goekera deserti]NEL53957.1 oxidoreductase [Goekera deserti]